MATCTHKYGRFTGKGRTQSAAHEDACRQASRAREEAIAERPDGLAVRSATRIGATEWVAVFAVSYNGRREGYFIVPRGPYREHYARDEVYFVADGAPVITEDDFYAYNSGTKTYNPDE